MRDGIPADDADGRAAGYAPAVVVVVAGVCAALHVGKLPPAIAALRTELGIGLVGAGFLLSLVQVAGMLAAVAVGAWVDRIGLKRCMALGLAVLGGAGLIGAAARGPGLLLASRAVESFGFLCVVLAATPLLRRIVPPARIERVIGFWGGYMPAGAAAGLLVGPVWIERFGWRSWWDATALVSFAALALVLRVVPAPVAPAAPVVEGVGARLVRTLSHRGPWLAALLFGVYSSQWLAVIGFLPTIYEQAGVDPGLRGVLTALAALVNFAGNVAAGALLARGVSPSKVLAGGYATMAVSAFLAFHGAGDDGLPMAGRYGAVLCFSGVGGLVPATLFALALRVAPDGRTVATTVGWMQQVSAFGQFCGPPLVAALAARVGGWHWTWAATGALSLAGLVLAWRLAAAGVGERRSVRSER
jgi:CP family cyanate transporter-like MFS transporter